MNRIEEIKQSLDRIDQRDIDSIFIKMIYDDCVAFGNVLNPCIVATTEADYQKFKTHFPQEWLIQPLSSFSELLESHYRSIDRCKALVVFTKAAQLIPYKLSQLMSYADKGNVPVLVFITGMDRVISKESVNISGQLSSVLLRNNYKWFDAKIYDSIEALIEEVSNHANKTDQCRRSQDLTIMRQSQLTEILNSSLNKLIQYQNNYFEYLKLIDEFHKKDILIETIKVDEVTNLCKKLIDSLQKIDPKSIVGSISNSDIQELIRQTIEKTTKTITKEINEHKIIVIDACKKESKKINERIQNRIDQTLKEVWQKFSLQTEKPSDIQTINLNTYIDRCFSSAESLIIGSISIPQYLTMISKYGDVLKFKGKDTTNNANYQQDEKGEKNNSISNNKTGKDDQNKNEDTDKPESFDNLNKLLSGLPLQLIQSKLPDVIQACIDDVCEGLVKLIRSVNAEIKDDIEESINSNFSQVMKNLMDEKYNIEKRLGSIIQVLDEIRLD